MMAAPDFPELLPAWIPWVAMLHTILLIGLVHLAVPMRLSHYATRIDDSEPWPERARHAHVARAGMVVWIVVAPVVAASGAFLFAGPASALSPPVIAATVSVISIGATLRRWRKVEGVLLTPAPTWREIFGAVLLGLGPVLLLLMAGLAAPNRVDSWWMVPWLAVVSAITHLWTTTPMALMNLGLGREARPALRTIVAQAADRAGVPMPTVMEAEVAVVNAFAYPWQGVIVFSERMVDLLDSDELEAITFHELAHLGEPRSMSVLRRAQVYGFIPIVALRPVTGSFGIAAYMLVAATVLLLFVLLRRRSLSFEDSADRAAVDAGHESSALAEALVSLHEAALIPAVIPRSSHGHLHDRLRLAGLEPDYEIPKPPPKAPHIISFVLGSLVFLVVAASPWLTWAVAPSGSTLHAQLAAGLLLYGADGAESLAWEAEANEEFPLAASWMEVAALHPDDGYRAANAAWLWSLAGECERAEHVLETRMASATEARRLEAEGFVTRCSAPLP